MVILIIISVLGTLRKSSVKMLKERENAEKKGNYPNDRLVKAGIILKKFAVISPPVKTRIYYWYKTLTSSNNNSNSNMQ